MISYRKKIYLLLSALALVTGMRAQNLSDSQLADQFDIATRTVILLKNDSDFLPLKRLDTLRVAYLPLGFDTLSVRGRAFVEGQELSETLGRYSKVAPLAAPLDADEVKVRAWVDQHCRRFNLFIVGIKDYTQFGQSDPSWRKHLPLIRAITASGARSVFIVVGRQSSDQWAAFEPATAVLSVPHTGIFVQSVGAQIVFGAIGATARTPVQLGPFPSASGIETRGGLRLAYVPPLAAGMDAQLLRDSIRAIVEEGIRGGAFPGAQVLVAKDGKVVYLEAFGHPTYESEQPATTDDLYDFASLTKITSALPALVKLHGEGKFDPDVPLKKYFPKFRFSNKAGLSFREMLAHQARLRPYIPYWVGTLRSSAKYPWKKGWNSAPVNDGQFRPHTFQPDSSAQYPYRITDSLWMYRNFRKQIYRSIRKSPLLEEKGYVYSGLLFILLPEIVSDLARDDYETYLNRHFYHRLGAYTLTYNPLRYFPKGRIAPTELDTFFRHELVQGTVHDEAAATMAGVSANAGLFGTANDVAKLMQMYLNDGVYGGEQLLRQESLREFIRCQFCAEGNRRGLGFDKPLLEYDESESYIARSASPSSFGHSGFTGTFAWADPENGLLFVFFSNRVYPTRDRRALYDLRIRPRLHQVAYDAVKR